MSDTTSTSDFHFPFLFSRFLMDDNCMIQCTNYTASLSPTRENRFESLSHLILVELSLHGERSRSSCRNEHFCWIKFVMACPWLSVIVIRGPGTECDKAKPWQFFFLRLNRSKRSQILLALISRILKVLFQNKSLVETIINKYFEERYTLLKTCNHRQLSDTEAAEVGNELCEKQTLNVD